MSEITKEVLYSNDVMIRGVITEIMELRVSNIPIKVEDNKVVYSEEVETKLKSLEKRLARNSEIFYPFPTENNIFETL